MSMMIVSKKSIFRLSLVAAAKGFVICALILAVSFPVFAQNQDDFYSYSFDDAFGTAEFGSFVNSSYDQHILKGVSLYRDSHWQEASNELRFALGGAATPRQSAEALYWLALSELGAGDYVNSLRVLDTLEKFGGERSVDIPYHRGRAYYYLGYYEESIIVMNNYAARLPEIERARRSSAYYWIGECLLALGQLDRARDIFMLITEEYADSIKYEAAVYRISIINQKKIEAELLALLKWTHEESLKTTDEYRRRERNFDIALSEYQRQLANESREQHASENQLAEYQRQLADYRSRIDALERLLAEQQGSGPSVDELRRRATQLRNDMESSARVIENVIEAGQ